jgi:tetratricopeptide (TPR) repeat protein
VADHCFISYSTADGLEFARRLADELEGGDDQYINVWLDKRDLHPGNDWDDQIVEAIKTSKCMLFVMTRDSVAPGSTCKSEWTFALKYKKPIIPIHLHSEAELPFGLGNRQWIDFKVEFEAGLARLRKYLRRVDSPEGMLDNLHDRLFDAERALRRANGEDETRIAAEVDDLKAQIKRQEEIVRNPRAAVEQTRKNIETGLERERQPAKPVVARTTTRFINPPPGDVPNYFQDRIVETKLTLDFLKNDSQRMMTVVGRGGIGKTAMVCRLLKFIESGRLPNDEPGALPVDGIIYLSESGIHRVNFQNLFADLSRLLFPETAEMLEKLYRDPQSSTKSKMLSLLDAFPSGKIIVLLDNFETVIDVESSRMQDAVLEDALSSLLQAPHHSIKVILTTRIAPRELNLIEPAKQMILHLDEGLASPYAENILREMDVNGTVGLKNAPDDLLNKARERTRGYPRALEALYAILFADYNTRLDDLIKAGDETLPELVVEKLVGEAFSRLDLTAQKVMQALAIYNHPVIPAAVDYLLQPYLPDVDSAPILNRLANMHFARREAGRYYLHPVDSQYALSRIPEFEFLADDDYQFEEDVDELEESPDWDLTFLSNNLNQLGFTQFDLQERAGDYFAEARKPRESWKKLEDLSAQLNEFDLRCVTEDYDTAAEILREIDLDCLSLWGHFHLLISLHEQLTDKIIDQDLLMNNLNSLGSAYHSIGQVRKSLDYFEKGLDAAREANFRDWEGNFLGNVGNSYAALGEIRKAIGCYEQALTITREIGDRNGEGANLGDMGRAYSALGDTRKAIEYYEQALKISKETDDLSSEGTWLGNLGSAYAAFGNTRKAIEYYEQALLIARNVGNRSGEGAWLGSIGSAYAAFGDTRKAIEYYDQALAITREIGDRNGEGANLGDIGRAYAAFGDTRKAIEYYEQSLKIARETEDRSGEGNRLGSIGNAYIDLGEISKAIEYYQQALAITRDTEDRSAEATSLGEMGRAYAALGDTRNAIEYYEQALIITQETENRSGEGTWLGNLGTTYDTLGEWGKAQEYYEQALAISRELEDVFNEGIWLGNLGLVCMNLAELDKAMEYYVQALKIAQKLDDRQGQIVNLENIGYLYIEMDDCLKAITHFEQAQTIADDIQYRSGQNIARCGLSYAHLLSGEIDVAHSIIEQARQFDVPTNNHNVMTLLGVITLYQNKISPAQHAFHEAFQMSGALLEKNPDNFDALDARGFALCGLVISSGEKSQLGQAIESFQKARKITNAPGIVKRNLRFFEQFALVDPNGILAEVRLTLDPQE